jgi:serine/threonine protein kinase
MTSEVHTLQEGALLKNKYEIVSVLGKGGFSTIYRGRDNVLGIDVAIKQFVPADGKEAVKNRLLQEARHVASLSGIAEITQVRDYFEENGSVFMVMEYVDGVTLHEYVKKQKGRMSWEEAEKIFRQVISALKKVHETGIIHRDVSPENIMILPDGKVKLLDFGALKYVGNEVMVGQQPDNTTTALVKRGYAPVEQYQSRGNLGPWTDVYGVCATIYFCLTGETPPEAPGRAISREELNFSERGVELPPHIEAALQEGMAVRVTNRIQNMDELGKKLFEDEKPAPEECGETAEQAPEDTEDTPEQTSGHRSAWWRRGVVAVCAAAAVVAVVAAIIFVWNRNPVQTVSGVNVGEELPEGTSVLYDVENLDELLADPGVDTIVIPEGTHIVIASAKLNKQLVVEAGAILEVGCLDIETEGNVKVDGILSAKNAILRTEGENAGISVSATGELRCNENTVLWTKTGSSQVISYESAKPATFAGRTIVLDEASGMEQALPVNSYEELVAAQKAGSAVRVESDIHFTDEFTFSVPVYVSEGVTITADDGLWLVFESELFVNYGDMDVGFNLGEHAFLLNYGTMTAGSEYATSLWAGEGSMTFNMGVIEGGDAARVWKDAYLYNVGTLDAYNFYLMGGTCFNYGSILAKTGGFSFTVTNAGRLYNYGSFEAEESSEVLNNGWTENAGSFIVGKDAVFDNNVFFNRGYFECGLTSTLNRQSGIYYGSGEFSINGLTSVAVWKTADWEFDTDYWAVTSEEELREALKDNEVSKIFVSSPIQIAEDIEITKPLFLNAALTVDGEAECSLKNTYAVLLSGGTLAAKTLSLDNALLVAEDGTASLTGAVLELDNRSSFAANRGEAELSQSTISAAHRSVISTPFEGEAAVEDASVVLEDSWLFLNRDTELKNTDISLQKEGNFCTYAESFACESSRIELEKDCTMTAQFGNIRFLSGTELTNSGVVRVDGWVDSSVTFSGATVTNYGELYVNLPGTADEESSFYNGGTLDIYWLDGESE